MVTVFANVILFSLVISIVPVQKKIRPEGPRTAMLALWYLIFSDIVSEVGLYDVAECFGHVRTVKYTHFQGLSHARLDRADILLGQVPVRNEYQVVPVSFSVHCLVSVGKHAQVIKVFLGTMEVELSTLRRRRVYKIATRTLEQVKIRFEQLRSIMGEI